MKQTFSKNWTFIFSLFIGNLYQTIQKKNVCAKFKFWNFINLAKNDQKL